MHQRNDINIFMIFSQLGSETTWKAFKNPPVQNERGDIKRENILTPPDGTMTYDPTKKAEALEECKKIHEDEPESCMVCMRDAPSMQKWKCVAYKEKFGGKSEEDIKKLSKPDKFWDCFFKDTDQNCQA